jgi:hypothetical protein
VTVTIGADGVAIGAATPEPGALMHPPTVCVTVYVPAVETVIDAVIAPVDHNKPDPVALKTELPQLFAADTTGADGTINGAATPEPEALVHPATV